MQPGSPLLRKRCNGLKALFSPLEWKKARDAGAILPHERTVDDGGEGHFAYALRLLREWLAASQQPDAPILLSSRTPTSSPWSTSSVGR